jgi:hypothetical protein
MAALAKAWRLASSGAKANGVKEERIMAILCINENG